MSHFSCSSTNVHCHHCHCCCTAAVSTQGSRDAASSSHNTHTTAATATAKSCNSCNTRTQLHRGKARGHTGKVKVVLSLLPQHICSWDGSMHRVSERQTATQTARQQAQVSHKPLGTSRYCCCCCLKSRGYCNLLLLEVPSDSTTTQVGGMEACIGVKCTFQGLHQSVLL